MSGKKEAVRRMNWDSKVYSKKRKETAKEIVTKIMHSLREKYNGVLDVAVDVGCGPGQSTIALAPFFNKVYGLDGLETQIREAESSRLLENITYRISLAESLPFKDNSVQLITAATSLHWFDLDKFFTESKRVLCHNGILAAYCYTRLKPLLHNLSSMMEIEKLYDEYYEAVKPYAMPKTEILKQNYRNVNFPFEDVRRETVRGLFKGCLTDICDYASSFSSIRCFREHDPDKAEQTFNKFKQRLYEISAKENVSPDETITLCIDYALIISRNVKT